MGKKYDSKGWSSTTAARMNRHRVRPEPAPCTSSSVPDHDRVRKMRTRVLYKKWETRRTKFKCMKCWVILPLQNERTTKSIHHGCTEYHSKDAKIGYYSLTAQCRVKWNTSYLYVEAVIILPGEHFFCMQLRKCFSNILKVLYRNSVSPYLVQPVNSTQFSHLWSGGILCSHDIQTS